MLAPAPINQTGTPHGRIARKKSLLKCFTRYPRLNPPTVVSNTHSDSCSSDAGSTSPVTEATDASRILLAIRAVQSGCTSTSSSVKATMLPELARSPALRARLSPGDGSRT